MTGRETIRGVEHQWASPVALREPCPSCGQSAVLSPARGRRGGPLLCLACGQAVRCGDGPSRPTLFDGEEAVWS
jgi:hypothetical protein